MSSPPSQAAPITRATLDRVARTELGARWLLLPFAVVTGLFAASILPKNQNAALFFAGLPALALATFAWAWFERRAAHRTLERLQASQRLIGGQGEVLRQYTVLVGLLVLAATFETRFYTRHRPLLATLTTALFGWWTFPWGPVRTVRAIASNLRGGTARTEAQLRAELSVKAPPPSPWWRRLLDLDSRSPVRIASRLATLGMVVVVVALVLTAFARSLLVETPGP